MKNICGRVFMDHLALCMMIMASIFLSGLGWVVLQACFVGWVGSISYWVGLGWVGSQKLNPRLCLSCFSGSLSLYICALFVSVWLSVSTMTNTYDTVTYSFSLCEKKLYCDFPRAAKHVNAQRILAMRGVSVPLSVSLSVRHMLVLSRLEINDSSEI